MFRKLKAGDKISILTPLTPFLGGYRFLYKIWKHQMIFLDGELYIILKIRSLLIREHSSFETFCK